MQDGDCQVSALAGEEKGLVPHNATEAGNENEVACVSLSGQYDNANAMVVSDIHGKRLPLELDSFGNRSLSRGLFLH